jgi:hypothetical protein
MLNNIRSFERYIYETNLPHRAPEMKHPKGKGPKQPFDVGDIIYSTFTNRYLTTGNAYRVTDSRSDGLLDIIDIESGILIGTQWHNNFLKKKDFDKWMIKKQQLKDRMRSVDPYGEEDW